MKRILAQIVVIMVIVFMAAGISLLWPKTMVNRPLFLLIVGLAAVWIAIISGKFWVRLVGFGPRVLSILIGILATAIMIGGGILTVNYIGVIAEGGEIVEAVVATRSQETHYKTRRVSRKVTARGAPYQVYYLTIEMERVGNRKMRVEKPIYDRVGEGDMVRIVMNRGALGWPVVMTDSIAPLHPRALNKKQQRRCRFVGSRGDKPLPEERK